MSRSAYFDTMLKQNSDVKEDILVIHNLLLACDHTAQNFTDNSQEGGGGMSVM